MTPLKDFRGVFSSFAASYVRYIINMYSIVNVINIKEALWHSTLRNA